MAASGFTPISLYYSTTASAVPLAANLANGELALNTADMKLYSKNSAGVVTLLAASTGATGTVSSVALSGGTTGLTVSGSPITTSGTITLAGTLATANGGTNLTSFTSGGAVYATSTSALTTGTLPIASGGTGQTTANAAFNALVPSQTSQSGKYLTTDGTNTSWGTNPLGTVTSVAASVPSFLSIAGSPITTSGTLAISLSGTALPTTSGGTGLTSFTSGGVVYASSTSALAQSANLTFNGTQLTTNNFRLNGFMLDGAGNVTFNPASAGSLSITSHGTYTNGNLVYNALAVSGVHTWQINSTEGMRLTSTGLGIGTSSPSYKLHVVGSAYISSKLLLDTGTSALPSLTFLGWVDTGIYNPTGTSLGFSTNGTERVRIDSVGNVLVGGTAARGTTAGTKHLDLFDGTAPAGTLTNGISLYSSSGDLKFMDSAGNAYTVGFRNVPQSGSSKTASYTLATTDVGEYILLGASGAIVIPDATFAAGDVITIFNNTASTATLTCSITTAYIAGTFTDKATMTLAAAGVATVLFITSTLCVVTGNVT